MPSFTYRPTDLSRTLNILGRLRTYLAFIFSRLLYNINSVFNVIESPMSPPVFEPFVHTKKTPFMQRMSDLARAGYTHWIGGVTTTDKLQGIADKFVERFRIDRDKSNVYKAIQRGEAAARLLSWCDEKSTRVHWVLMIKPEKAKTDDGKIRLRGKAVVLDKSEKWRDLTTASGRLTLTGYELVREPKPKKNKPEPLPDGKKAPPAKKSKKPPTRTGGEPPKPKSAETVWTWRYDKNRLQDLRSQIIHAIRNRADAELSIMIRDTWATPGFSGARKQVKEIGTLVKSEWKRASRKADIPAIPEHLGFLRRLSDTGCKLSTLKRRLVLAENRRLKKGDEKPDEQDLTHDSNQTIIDRLKRDPDFAKALRDELQANPDLLSEQKQASPALSAEERRRLESLEAMLSQFNGITWNKEE